MWIDDLILKRCQEPFAVHSWIPERSHVVLGSSNQAERECNVAACQQDGVEILRRAGGGGTVVLHPGCLVITVGTWVRHYYENSFYFRLLNQMIIGALSVGWPLLPPMSQAGISDIVIGDRKICGTSLFRSRNYLLFQTSLLVEDRLPLIERYLAHPSKEPDYRQGRSHRAFISSLDAFVAGLTALQVHSRIAAVHWEDHMGPLRQELIHPVAEQIPHVFAKSQKSSE